ncbi:hypothetical protein [Bacillus bingmayongensis]|uniref:hypothetical protein n=1 Tax=Bacillus bingmayongensis TaxID=1150157 RepID=UPI00031F6C86|nr:hypothetical protein [Bacillus bingmayongensis]
MQKKIVITKVKIETLVKNGAKEQELQRLLKQDLSIFAEVYAYPSDEYICFSEFPIGNTGKELLKVNRSFKLFK